MTHYVAPSASRMRRGRGRFVVFVVSICILLACAVGGGFFWIKAQANVAKQVPSKAKSRPKPQKAKPAAEKPAEPKTTPDVAIPPVENGLAPVITSLPTKQPVVFLTIDDGIHKDPAALALLKQHELKASLYLTYDLISDNPSFFKAFVAAGMPVENHTMTHRHLTTLSYAEQKQEICSQADIMEKLYGRRPLFLRPPGGHYNIDTQRAAAECGMKAVAMWIAKANGGSMQYQIGNGLQPGDIVLMHFRPEFQQDLQSFVDAQRAANLRTELLDDWLAH